MNAYPSSLGQLPAPQSPWKGYWKRFGGKFLIFSALAHLLFAMGAAYLVIHTFSAPIPHFQPTLPSINSTLKADIQKVQTSDRARSFSVPIPPRRVVSVEAANVTIPAIADSPTADVVQFTPMNVTGLPSYQHGSHGPGQAGPGTSCGPSGPYVATPYGQNAIIPGALKGTFYDLKLTSGRRDSGMTFGKYADTVNQFVKGNWNDSLLNKYLKGPRALYATQIFFPEIDSNEAPRAFDSPAPDSPGMWVVVYKGTVSPPDSGTYRFVGAGDDDMIVRFDGRLVLDKCEHIDPLIQSEGTYHYARLRNEFGRGIPVTAEAGKFYNVEVLIGDHIPSKTMAVLLIEKEGVNYEKEGDAPVLPAFFIAADKPQPAVSADTAPTHVENGPAWKGKASSSSMLDNF